jgi:gliding motility-associated protein GldC
MTNSSITINVLLNEEKVPEQISWAATNSTAEDNQSAKAVLLALWNGAEKTAMRIDLWTKEMMVDEMGDFFYQTLITMADTLQRATHKEKLVIEMKQFAKNFYQQFKEDELKENKI